MTVRAGAGGTAIAGTLNAGGVVKAFLLETASANWLGAGGLNAGGNALAFLLEIGSAVFAGAGNLNAGGNAFVRLLEAAVATLQGAGNLSASPLLDRSFASANFAIAGNINPTGAIVSTSNFDPNNDVQLNQTSPTENIRFLLPANALTASGNTVRLRMRVIGASFAGKLVTGLWIGTQAASNDQQFAGDQVQLFVNGSASFLSTTAYKGSMYTDWAVFNLDANKKIMVSIDCAENVFFQQTLGDTVTGAGFFFGGAASYGHSGDSNPPGSWTFQLLQYQKFPQGFEVAPLAPFLLEVAAAILPAVLSLSATAALSLSTLATLAGSLNLSAATPFEIQFLYPGSESRGEIAYSGVMDNQTFSALTSATVRSVMPVTGKRGAFRVRVTFSNGTVGLAQTINNASIGIWDSSTTSGLPTGNTTATPIELLFSGAHGFALPAVANSSVTSDWVSLSFSPSDRLIVIADYANISTKLADHITANNAAGCLWFNAPATSYNVSQNPGDWQFASAVIVLVTEIDDTSAVLSGNGNLAANDILGLAALASFAGAGNFSADGYRGLSAACSFALSGGLSASTFLIETAQANLALVGNLSASIAALLGCAGTFSGAGGLSGVTPFELQAALGSLPIAGTLRANAGAVLTSGQVNLTGAGNLSAAAILLETASASLAIVGTLTVTIFREIFASASFNCAAALSATAIELQAAAASFALAGALSASTPIELQAALAQFAPVGGLSANNTMGLAGSASFSGSGTLAAPLAKLIEVAAANLAGAGNLSASAGMVLPAQASFAGAGSFGGVSAFLIETARATLSGLSDLSADGQIAGSTTVLFAAASLQLSGGLRATAMLELAAFAQFSPSGSLSALANTLHIWFASASLAGSLNMSAVAILELKAVANLAASLTMASSPFALLIGGAHFAGQGGLGVVANLDLTASARFAIDGSLSARANTWRRIIRILTHADTCETVSTIIRSSKGV